MGPNSAQFPIKSNVYQSIRPLLNVVLLFVVRCFLCSTIGQALPSSAFVFTSQDLTTTFSTLAKISRDHSSHNPYMSRSSFFGDLSVSVLSSCLAHMHLQETHFHLLFSSLPQLSRKSRLPPYCFHAILPFLSVIWSQRLERAVYSSAYGRVSHNRILHCKSVRFSPNKVSPEGGNYYIYISFYFPIVCNNLDFKYTSGQRGRDQLYVISVNIA